MFSKINILSIVLDHVKTLNNYRNGKISIADLCLFFVIPFITSILLIYFKVQVSKEFANAILTSFSIFAGLLFNLLLLIFDIAEKQDDSRKDMRTALRELYVNISFCILISMIIIIFSLCFFTGLTQKFYLNILSFLVYFPLLIFMFTLFMVLKRIYKLLSQKLGK